MTTPFFCFSPLTFYSFCDTILNGQDVAGAGDVAQHANVAAKVDVAVMGEEEHALAMADVVVTVVVGVANMR